MYAAVVYLCTCMVVSYVTKQTFPLPTNLLRRDDYQSTAMMVMMISLYVWPTWAVGALSAVEMYSQATDYE
jgi:hypothetical protein